MRDAAPLDGRGQPAHQPGGVDGRAVGRVRRAADVRAPASTAVASPASSSRSSSSPRPQRAGVGDLGPRPAPLRRGAGQRDRCRPWPAGRRCPRRRRPARPRRRWPASPGAGPARPLAAGRRGQRGQRGGEQRRAPAAVAAGRAEAGDLGLEHRDPQVGSAPRRGSSAVHSPVRPAPTTATSTSRSPASAGRGVQSSAGARVPQRQPGVTAQRTPHE